MQPKITTTTSATTTAGKDRTMFTVNRETLLSALQTVSQGNASVKRGRVSIPVLACVQLTGHRADDAARIDTITLATTDLEIAVTTTINAASALDATVCVDSKALIAAVKGLRKGAVVQLWTQDGATTTTGTNVRLHVYGDGITTTLDTWDNDEYPLLPTMPDNGAVAVLPAADMARMITETAPHAATDDCRPIFTGIYTQVHDDHVTMAAADGYRLATATTTLDRAPWANAESMPHGIGAIVPARAMVALSKIVGKGAGMLVCDFGNPNKEADRATFTYGDTTMTTRLISGKYVNYQQIVPAGHDATVTAERAELATTLDTFKRACKGIGNEVMYVHEAEGGLILSMAGEGSMGAFVRAAVTTTAAEPMAPFAVNPAMLAAAVASMGSVDSVAIGTPDQAAKPMTITAVGRDDVRVVVMPMSAPRDGGDAARDKARGITRNKYGIPSAPVADVAGHAAATTSDETAGDGWENVTAIREAAAAAERDDAADSLPVADAPTTTTPAVQDPYAAVADWYARRMTGDTRFYCDTIAATAGDGLPYAYIRDRALGDRVVSPDMRASYVADVCDRLNREHVPTMQAYGIISAAIAAPTTTCEYDDVPVGPPAPVGDAPADASPDAPACDPATTAAYLASVARLDGAGIVAYRPVMTWEDNDDLYYVARGDDHEIKQIIPQGDDDDRDLVLYGARDDDEEGMSLQDATTMATTRNDELWRDYTACYAGTLDTATYDDDPAPAVTTTAPAITTDSVLEVIATMDNETLTHCRYAAEAARDRGHSVDCQWQHDGQVYWCQCAQCNGPIVVIDGAVHALPTSCQAPTSGEDDDASTTNYTLTRAEWDAIPDDYKCITDEGLAQFNGRPVGTHTCYEACIPAHKRSATYVDGSLTSAAVTVTDDDDAPNAPSVPQERAGEPADVTGHDDDAGQPGPACADTEATTPDARRKEQMATAIRAALAEGVYMQEAMRKYVYARCGDDDNARETFLGVVPWESGENERETRKRLRAMPRGTWIVLQQDRDDHKDEPWYTPIMSAGDGELTGHRDTSDTMPTYEHTFERMYGYEVYIMRRAIEDDDARRENTAALQEYGIEQGQTYREMKAGGHTYTRIAVTSVDTDKGTVSYEAKRKGGRTRYTGAMEAIRFVRACGIASI